MFNNKIKNNRKVLYISFALMIFFTILTLIFSIVAIVTWKNNNSDLNKLAPYACGLLIPLFVGSFCLYLFSSNESNKKLNIIFISCISFAFVIHLIGTILFLVCQNNNIVCSLGMWFLIISSFALVFISFGTLISYLYKKQHNKSNFEKVIKDPEY